MADKVLTGAIAIIKVNGLAIGKMRDIRINESFRRVRVSKGLGSIFADEFAMVEWAGTISCSFFEINFKKSGINGAIARNFIAGDILSQVGAGVVNPNFEDQIVLDDVGVTIEVFKKVKDIVLPNGLIVPDAEPYATVRGCFIESDNVNVSEGQIAGRDQSFQYLLPVVTN
jgi:hypothetical protein